MKYPYGQTAYNRSLRPAGSTDIMLGRNLGTGCQLKYADDLFQISQTQLPDTSYMCTGQSPLPDTSVSDEHAALGEIGTLVTAMGWIVPDNPAVENSTNLVIAMGWPAPAATPKMINASTAETASQQVTQVLLH